MTGTAERGSLPRHQLGEVCRPGLPRCWSCVGPSANPEVGERVAVGGGQGGSQAGWRAAARPARPPRGDPAKGRVSIHAPREMLLAPGNATASMHRPPACTLSACIASGDRCIVLSQ